ncbi:MAG: hypothetical protein HYY62_04535 [Deltaproteobacteria bacterium]|nr:hypothetical protein [Deltaproteobacteria bacterium]
MFKSDQEPNYVKTLQGIANAIEALKNEFPQLKDFSASENLDQKRLVISYQFHTHEPERRVGWTGGVPNPDDDGIWFYIDFHEPGSMAQIHTQPVTIPLAFGKKRVSFLILEGQKTKRVGAYMMNILKKQGIQQRELGE